VSLQEVQYVSRETLAVRARGISDPCVNDRVILCERNAAGACRGVEREQPHR
jgi:hypothetical protein